jgi:hypothetical protein
MQQTSPDARGVFLVASARETVERLLKRVQPLMAKSEVAQRLEIPRLEFEQTLESRPRLRVTLGLVQDQPEVCLVGGYTGLQLRELAVRPQRFVDASL